MTDPIAGIAYEVWTLGDEPEMLWSGDDLSGALHHAAVGPKNEQCAVYAVHRKLVLSDVSVSLWRNALGSDDGRP